MSGKKIFLISISVKLFLLSLCLFFVAVQYEPTSSLKSGNVINTAVDVQGQYDSLGFTELSKAASCANMDIVTYYINQRLPLNVQAQNIDAKTGIASGNTPVHFAMWDVNWDSNFEIAKMLIRAGAKVTIPNSQGNQLVHTLIVPVNLDRRTELLSMLVQHGADVNAQNNEGETMSHMATYDTEKEWIGILAKGLGFLVDFSIKNNKGETVYDLAKAVGNNTDTILDELFNRKNITILGKSGLPLARNVTISGSTIQVGDMDLFTNERDFMGLTLLMIAVVKGDQNFAKQVLRRAGNSILNERVADEDQNSALHLALLHQAPDMVNFLLSQKDTKPNIQNAFGDTPLHYIFKLDDADARKKTARALFVSESAYLKNQVNNNKLTKQQAIQYASINIKNNKGNGFTPLELAVNLPARDAYDFIVSFLIGELLAVVPSSQSSTDPVPQLAIANSTYDAAIALANKKASSGSLGDLSFCSGVCSVGDLSSWTDAKIYFCIACELQVQRDTLNIIQSSAAL